VFYPLLLTLAALRWRSKGIKERSQDPAMSLTGIAKYRDPSLNNMYERKDLNLFIKKNLTNANE
jgi:hypothetical protein